MNVENLRQEFEAIPEIKAILTEIAYFKECNCYGFYGTETKCNPYRWVNGAWWQFQQMKIKLEGCVVLPKSCQWTQDSELNWWTECGEGFVFNEDPHPNKHNFKNCCFCGGLLEAKVDPEE